MASPTSTTATAVPNFFPVTADRGASTPRPGIDPEDQAGPGPDRSGSSAGTVRFGVILRPLKCTHAGAANTLIHSARHT